MKLKLLFSFLLFSVIGFSQIPKAFKYQAVVRDANGIIVVNRLVSIKTSILSGSTSGTPVYVETQTLSTNDYGVVSLYIGSGTIISGNFSTINWEVTTYFVKTELDINGASTYVFMGTSQLLSVPYALYAEKSGSSNSDHDTSVTNEIQTLSLSGNNLSISGGNSVSLPPDSDANPTNELQSLSLNGDSLRISKGNAVYLSGVIDLDASPTNELQNLNLNNDTLKISMGNNVVFPHDYDRDTTNEIQSLNLNNDTLKISKSNSVVFPHDYDRDTTNELQLLSRKGDTLILSKGNFVVMPKNNDNDSTNELQNLSLKNDTLFISKGNSVKFNKNFKYSPHLYNTGDGSDGNFLSIGNDSIIGVKYFKSFYLKAGDTLHISERTIIKVQDSCIISGVIDGVGRGSVFNFSNPSSYNQAGGSGGGGGGNFNAPDLNIDIGYLINLPGGKAGSFADGNTFSNPQINQISKETTSFLSLAGGPGSKGGCNQIIGGNGGAGLYIVCEYFKFTGTINLSGTSGTQYTNACIQQTAPCGGGGGGSCLISTENLVNATGAFILNGGNGGIMATGYGFAGKGGSGWSKIIVR